MNTQLIIPALGHKVFEPQPSADEDEPDELLYFSRNQGKGGRATGKIADDGFWVLKGSYIYPKMADYLPSGVVKARQRYVDLIDNQGILQRDVSFGSPSYAASFVCGKNSNGLIEWKNKDGISLKDINENAAGNGKKPKKSKKEKAVPVQPIIAPVSPENTTILHLASKKLMAQGYVSGDSFVVLKGSQMSPNLRQSCRAWVKTHRYELIDSGKVVNFVFTEDVSFSSPSAAAAAILGGESNGLILWKTDAGIVLKQLFTEQDGGAVK